MGASLVYLDKPNKEIEFEFGEDDHLEYVAAGMQGWRLNMEDAHIAALNLASTSDKRLALFGVFDGHGGGEVARWVRLHYTDIVTNNANFKKEKFEECFRETFLQVDVELESESG